MADDPGIGNERTALAWQRTALSLIAAAAVVTRLTVDRLGAVALVCLVVAVPLSGWVLLQSRGRYATRRRHHAGPGTRPGGRAPAALALSTVVVALTELAALANWA